MSEKPTMSAHEVAEAFGISYNGLLKMIRRGETPGGITIIRVGNLMKFSRAEVNRVLKVSVDV